ncbi:Hexaprenyldihydroxybenzoate methyltransferase, mitochondrial [Perkinsus olseni]|uniref:Hexaprenyldihydroxybenzoate methyltransferase, mitochondrial n=1 Tax=Perkinsus olseni TaxID=32597 RepID=A0A7J6TFG7_PEROL|nr:Hexaprenyldihydroxybenzoate methyltransferase, mitochondrial [Perkinsus olseni]
MDLRKAMQEIYRVLKPGGVVVFDTISRNFKSYLLVWLVAQELLQVMYNDTHDWRLFITPEEMERLLGDIGFVVGKCMVRYGALLSICYMTPVYSYRG